jgi:iron complex outermembrane receptor protein
MYLNGLPFTDAGGNTYLNLIDPSLLENVEIIKGPGGSLYGAGTGGVVLMKTKTIRDNYVDFFAQRGSFNSKRYGSSIGIHNENVTSAINFNHVSSDGYREQSALTRDVFSSNFNFKVNSNHVLSADVYYTDLSYETPGGLTLDQFGKDPSQARPAGGPNPGAIDQQAAIYNKTIYLGLTHEATWMQFQAVTSFYGSWVDFVNPSIREYEVRKENNRGLRSTLTYSKQVNKAEFVGNGGVEIQYLDSPIEKYQNLRGEKGTEQSDDDLTSFASMVFLQGDLIVADWIFTMGLSANFYKISFHNVTEAHTREFDPAFSPRVTVLREFDNYSLFGGFSRGFSPPTVADLYPSGGEFSQTLDAEFGNNFELGIKGDPDKRYYYEVSAYDLSLKNTIVRREEDAEYFVNAGETIQRGVEAMGRWKIIQSPAGALRRLSISSSYGYNHYRFKDYLKVTDDLSNNKLTGVAPSTAYAGLDAVLYDRLSLSLSFNYVDHIPLNDENTAFSKPYNLLAARLTYMVPLRDFRIEVYAGGDNLLDEKYSLGSDVNALAGRYYNAAPSINFYGGLKLHVFEKRK